MSILGLGDSGSTAVKEKKPRTKASKGTNSKPVSKPSKSQKDSASTPSSQEDEAKALLEKMEAKKDADECPFC